MNFRTHRFPALCLTVLIASCGDPGPPLVASDVIVVAPLPGRQATAAYMTLHNRSEAPISIRRVSSPQFGSVEMHESAIVDGVVRMRALEALTVGAEAAMKLEPRGKHLMLIDPAGALLPGDTVTLRLEHDADGLLEVEALVKTRM